MKKYITTLILFVLFGNIVWAQTAPPKIKILGVNVVGTETATPEVVLATSGLKVGREVTGDDLAEAVKRLWQLKLFSDIRIFQDHQTAEGVYLIISVKEYPRLDKVVITGNHHLKTDKIKDELKLYAGQVLTPAVVYKARRQIQALYYKDGYLLAKIEATTFPGEKPGTRSVKFAIEENQKVKIQHIEFVGNHLVSDRKLKRQMEKIKEERWWKFWSEADFSRRNLDADEAKVVDFYKSKGYRDAEVLGDSIYYSDDLKKMFIQIRVHEGAQYHYGQITVSGNTVLPTDEILSAMKIKRGDVYNAEKLEQNIELGVRAPYLDMGYLYAQIQPLEIPVAPDTVNINLQIIENSPVYIRHINIVGNDKTKENVIRRELHIYPGDLFSRRALMRSQRDIMILNYFANVNPNIVPQTQDSVDLEFEVEEKNTGRATASAGYSERDGLIGQIGLQFPNFLGNGQQLSFSFQRAYSYQSISASFVEPWLFDTPNLVGFTIFDRDRTRGDISNPFAGQSYVYTPYDVHSRGGSITFGRRFQWPDNYFRGRWTFQGMVNHYDTTKVYDWNIFNRINPEHLVNTSGLSLSQTITRDSRNAPEFPTQGSVLRLITRYSGFGGNESFFKQRFSLEWYSPLYRDKFAMRNYLEMGALEKLKTGSKYLVPYDEYFFMGGAGLIWGTPLRGYPERSVGPAYGGKATFKYTLELRYKLSDNPLLYLISFAEAGNTWDKISDVNMFELRRSVGVGGRIIMAPLGLIGVDFGWGLDREQLGLSRARLGSPEVHFIFNQQF